MRNQLVTLAIQELPVAIAAFKRMYHRLYPESPEPSDEDVMGALESAYMASVVNHDPFLPAGL